MRKSLLILLFIGSLLIAAEFRDGTLYLEINLSSGLNLSIEADSMDISDVSELFHHNAQGKLDIAMTTLELENRYGFIDRIEEGRAEHPNDCVQREYFSWEDDRLILKQESIYYRPESFSDIVRAQKYAEALGLAPKDIQQIPIGNATVSLKGLSGQSYFLESPLKIISDQLWIDGLCYDGEFRLKVVEDRLVLNQLLPLEEYIAGVVPNEIGNYSPAEALKAQAVAARTHAVNLLLYNRHTKDGYDLCNGTHCQVYKGRYQRNAAIEEAVEQTAAEILITTDRVADATYHSSCGGKTDSSQAIWNGGFIPHLSGSTCIPQADQYDLSTEKGAANWLNIKPQTQGMSSWERGTLFWEKQISRKALAKNLGLSRINSIQIIKRGRSGRILTLKIKGNKEIILNGEYKIRQAFDGLPSSFFYFEGNAGKSTISPPATIMIKGRGSGHGVGMCQVGALRLARTDHEYTDILQIYYPKTLITTDWIQDEQP
ncbi:MAG: SpoIID/LytB domain-containing protein [Candidatus Cloacimonadaceae bacterium]|nr:SpoIID/LytB domain-containing protein [Candidatus Cloacimonadota bacterium]MCK9177667.1 SpoIID/LytB domain-containing protein [Candidatus Cloacimonadota bacterium]